MSMGHKLFSSDFWTRNMCMTYPAVISLHCWVVSNTLKTNHKLQNRYPTQPTTYIIMWRVVCAWCRVSSYTFSCRGEWVIILSSAGFTTHIIVQPALAPQTKSCTLPQSQYTLFIIFENVVVHDGDSAQVVFQQVLDGINLSGLAYCGYFTLLSRLENTKTPIINFRLYLPHNPLLS